MAENARHGDLHGPLTSAVRLSDEVRREATRAAALESMAAWEARTGRPHPARIHPALRQPPGYGERHGTVQPQEDER